MNPWKVLFVGMGSIAKRHIKNLHALTEVEEGVQIDIFRSGKGAKVDLDIEQYLNEIYYDYDDVPAGYDIVFITNPTQFHLNSLEKFHEKGKNFFIEKPLCTVNQLKDATLEYLREDSIYYVACPLRYTKVIQYVKNNFDLQKIKAVRSISSSYLPDWRPGIDYRNTYSAQKQLGGGVSIDLIHEWDYLYYLFGEPSGVKSIIKKISDLEIDADDIAVYIAEYPDKIVELHLDYFGRYPIRKFELFMIDDTIECDLLKSEISFAGTGEKIHLEQERNAYQIEELMSFLDLIRNSRYGLHDINRAKAVLELAGGLR